ncbi:MAG: LapA family protein [Sulfuritalea sp.]|nr:LapA family protein [Sulfuritalea sp.]
MQLILIVGIIIAIGAVIFALQNNTPVMVTLALWSFEGSLALVLLVSLGLGALIAGLLSSPAVIRGQWTARRLRNQVADLERQLAEQHRRKAELDAELARQSPPAASIVQATEKPYVGLRALLSGGDVEISSPQTEATSEQKRR